MYREPALIAVTVDGYDFEREGGYVVVSAGGQQAHIRRIQYPYYLYYTEALLYYKKIKKKSEYANIRRIQYPCQDIRYRTTTYTT